jgi:hypothetical protein
MPFGKRPRLEIEALDERCVPSVTPVMVSIHPSFTSHQAPAALDAAEPERMDRTATVAQPASTETISTFDATAVVTEQASPDSAAAEPVFPANRLTVSSVTLDAFATRAFDLFGDDQVSACIVPETITTTNLGPEEAGTAAARPEGASMDEAAPHKATWEAALAGEQGELADDAPSGEAGADTVTAEDDESIADVAEGLILQVAVDEVFCDVILALVDEEGGEAAQTW